MPYVPMKDPQLSDMVYEMIIAHYLANDQKVSCLFLFISFRVAEQEC
jgi:hypothetical protein